MSRAIIYIHGQFGSAEEVNFYKELFPNDFVIGFDYHSDTPWSAVREFRNFYYLVKEDYCSIAIIANSIGAYFAMCSLNEMDVEKAYFISPIVNMEYLIQMMMDYNSISLNGLEEKGEIQTKDGNTISYKYLSWVKNNPVIWNIPTTIIYGENDHLQPKELIEEFANKTNSKLHILKDGEHFFHTDEQMEFIAEHLKVND